MAGTFTNQTILKLNSTTVSEVVSITGPGLSADAVDVTSLSSSNKYREFIQGLRDGGEISIEGNFDTSNSANILDIFNTSSVVSATIDIPTSPSVSRWSSNVIVTAYETSTPLDDKVGYSATLKITGKPELAQV